jgi:flagellar biosynthesis protein FlhG
LPDDQASRLRRIKQAEAGASRPRAIRTQVGARRICVTSGKGGVGKSNFALNAAIVLAQLKQKVLLIDADTNLANLDILLGMNPKFNLADVVTGDKTMREVIVAGPGGIDILPGSSGVLEMLELDLQVQRRLTETFTDMERDYNFIIIDTGAGLTPNILSYVTAADEAVLITSREPTSIADAYAMIKAITHMNPTLPISLLINLVQSQDEAAEVFDGLRMVVQHFLKVPVNLLGYLPRDPYVIAAVARQAPFVLAYPRCPASVVLQMTVRKLLVRGRSATNGDDGSLVERMFQRSGMVNG